MKTESELLKEAQSDYLHNACNLIGVVNSFVGVLSDLTKLADIQNQSTHWVNQHKITRLWINKISDLSGYEWLSETEKSKLFD